MAWLKQSNIGLHWQSDGPSSGRPLLFLNSLGTDLRMWDEVVNDLAKKFHCIRMDTRGHGLSDAPVGAYSVETLAHDAVSVLDQAQVGRATIIGISLGGITAMQIAAEFPDRVSALVLSNTAPKLGTTEMWQARISAIKEGGMDAIADQILERWFAVAEETCASGPWRNMLTLTPVDGYLGCCEALASADLTSVLPEIPNPTLVIGGSSDGASPPEIVKAGAEMMQQSEYIEISTAGHLPPIETPDVFLRHVGRFLDKTAGH